MKQSDIRGYEYTGVVVTDDEVVSKQETARDGVYWVRTEQDVYLVTRHPELDVWMEIFSEKGQHDLDIDVVKVPKDDIGKKMLLPGEYIVKGDFAYVLNKTTKAPHKDNETAGSDRQDPIDGVPNAVIGVHRTVLDYHVTSTVVNVRNAMKNIAYIAYSYLSSLRDLYGAEWGEKHQDELTKMHQLSNGFYTKEEASLLAISLAEKVIDDVGGN